MRYNSLMALKFLRARKQALIRMVRTERWVRYITIFLFVCLLLAVGGPAHGCAVRNFPYDIQMTGMFVFITLYLVMEIIF